MKRTSGQKKPRRKTSLIAPRTGRSGTILTDGDGTPERPKRDPADILFGPDPAPSAVGSQRDPIQTAVLSDPRADRLFGGNDRDGRHAGALGGAGVVPAGIAGLASPSRTPNLNLQGNDVKYAPAPAGSTQIAQGEGIGLDDVVPAPPSFVNAGPPTSQPIDPYALMKTLNFDPKGMTIFDVSVTKPVGALQARNFAGVAEDAAQSNFPKLPRANNERDAYRHALWNYLMAQEFGPAAAKLFADGFEISNVNAIGETMMDLYNNNMGRKLAMDPANKGKAPEDAVMDALIRGELQEQPFKIGTVP